MVRIDIPGDDLEDAITRARDAHNSTEDINDTEYLEALTTVLDYEIDETYDTDDAL